MVFAQERTLRVDYTFCGGESGVQVCLDNMHDCGPWYGRNVNKDKMPPVRGNGSIVMRDKASGNILYTHTFSTLFQEWRLTNEAKRISKSFENVFLLPMPPAKASITVTLTGEKADTLTCFTHEVDPTDILIEKAPANVPGRKVQKILDSGSSNEKIDVVILSEGYSSKERKAFFRDARKGLEAIFSHGAFKKHKDKFNFFAVFVPSSDSGVSVPSQGIWRNTALESHYDTFYMDRYLTTSKLFKLHDVLKGIPYEHIIILANEETYGGGGIYNSYTLTTAGHPKFLQVLSHEFGHSFGALGDEYAYDDMDTSWYPEGFEPWEKNITTGVDFDSKWKDMVGLSAPNGDCAPFKVGLYEGAGYQTKGAFRPVDGCIMRILEDKDGHKTTFCPVCERAIGQMVQFYTGD